MNRRHRFLPLLIAGLGLLLSACQTTAPRPLTPTAEGNQGKPDGLVLVNCVLPSQIRKLGNQIIFLAPRQAIRTTASDCDVRGGQHSDTDLSA